MKIESLTLHHISMPLVAPFETSFGRETERECAIVEIKSEGLTGWGECVASYNPGYSYETTGTAMHILKDFIAPLILGKDIKDALDFQNRVEGIRGHHLAKAGVEMALWDLLGKREGKSLRQLFGGIRDKVEVGVSVGIQDSPEKLIETVAGFVKDGYARVKLKIKPGKDVSFAGAVRSAFPDIRLQVDANSAYSMNDADSLKPLDDLNLLLIEQPLFEDDIWDHHKFQAKFNTPVCLDESIVSPRHARYAIEMKACKIINIKAGRLGGLSQGIMVHDLCRENNMPVWCGGMLETGIGRASNLALASLPNFILPGDVSASDRYYKRDITNERFVLNSDSTIDVPTGHGLGVTVDEDALKSYTRERVGM
ncbi:MAG: o-succinylbenzoate synthase [Chloroflexi bacterium CFX1]|nr:o-succinylbenzoate synthase [Chloroflexi bacterium CFX1]MCQ3952445.1 o-succinylbenzoate synthase [Chloroflexota bacterium]MDL1919081.1 o-succinylbenzoate synthase [Chloroflexi bacterium CFX5]NUQ59037.1 o-succinylbenzoate synthase [Anaerolineales bacterium]